MTVGERVKFDQEAAVVVDCYALGVSRIIKNAPGKIAVHPNEILDDPAKRALHMQLAAGEQYPTQLRENIAADFGRLLKGQNANGPFNAAAQLRGEARAAQCTVVDGSRGQQSGSALK